MHVFKTDDGVVLQHDGKTYLLEHLDWDELFTCPDPATLVIRNRTPLPDGCLADGLEAPIGKQEVWAAGVTYFRSRDARMQESAGSGGSDFYDRVYEADRPELFFKATAHRVASPGGPLRIRSDSQWNVPEPELTLAVSATGTIFGYTIGNDMSSRDIEGRNPLYLPQAKVYDGCCGLGPGILISSEPLSRKTAITMVIHRDRDMVFEGTTILAQLKRQPRELVDYLFRDNSFPNGCFLMTGTGIVPESDFTLRSGDRIQIAIDRIGELVNFVQ